MIKLYVVNSNNIMIIIKICCKNVYLSVELVVTEIQRCIDWTEWFKVDVDLLFFAFLCDDCTTINHKTIRWH